MRRGGRGPERSALRAAPVGAAMHALTCIDRVSVSPVDPPTLDRRRGRFFSPSTPSACRPFRSCTEARECKHFWGQHGLLILLPATVRARCRAYFGGVLGSGSVALFAHTNSAARFSTGPPIPCRRHRHTIRMHTQTHTHARARANNTPASSPAFLQRRLRCSGACSVLAWRPTPPRVATLTERQSWRGSPARNPP